jgi:putative hydrolase of the HAD superfamily
LKRDTAIDAVTFDCWNTLLYETDPQAAQRVRTELLAHRVRESGIEVTDETAVTALGMAWRRHWQEWKAGVVTGAEDMARWSLESFGISDPPLAATLGAEFQEVALDQGVLPLAGAGDTLEALARRGIRRALICDTGYSPARIVRQLLDRAHLLGLLEVQIFSDEEGVPKPHARVFQAALEALDVATENAVHVGDLRRTDVAGARALGMGSVRLRCQHDDSSDLPEADAVADSHRHLLEILGVSTA